MVKTGIIYDAFTISSLTGIQNDGKHTYELVKLSFSDLSQEVKNNYKKLENEFKNDYYIQSMVNRLKLGGSLPAIILCEDNMNILDGCHRVWAYYFTNTENFHGLLKKNIIE